MEQLYKYFRKLSEGKLDITKTVEYQFMLKLQELDTPIGLNDFARELDMTSIVSKFIDLITKGRLLNQSPYGIDSNLSVTLSPEEDAKSTKGSVSKPRTLSDQVFDEAIKSGPATPSSPSIPSPSTKKRAPIPKAGVKPPKNSDSPAAAAPPAPKSSSPVPAPNKQAGPPKPNSTPPGPSSFPQPASNDANDELELPPHMQEKLNLERAKTGSKRTNQLDKDSKELDLDFDKLGSIEDDLEE